MTRSTCWSLLALSLAIMSSFMHRDISANIFLCSLFVIQAVKPQDEARLNQSSMTICAMFGTAVAGFAVLALVFGLQWGRPASW